jgi:hypothetical protein
MKRVAILLKFLSLKQQNDEGNNQISHLQAYGHQDSSY